jgi:hypothetical protein
MFDRLFAFIVVLDDNLVGQWTRLFDRIWDV